MCNNDNTALVPYTLKNLSDPNTCAAAAYVSLNHNLTQAALEHYRLQLYNYASYADRFRYTHPVLSAPFALASPYGSAGHHPHQVGGGVTGGPSAVPHDAFVAISPYAKFDPRAYRIQEEPKPQHSYIGLIGMAILSTPEKKLVLSDIYQYILDNYAYFRARGPGWRNSIRHNLSLNDCFIKSGRSANGKGHYWAIHPANLEDFKKGDFRRRKAQRRVRKHMGLSVPEDEDSTSPPPLPASSVSPRPTTPNGSASLLGAPHFWNDGSVCVKPDSTTTIGGMSSVHAAAAALLLKKPSATLATCLPMSRRRQFDMESLLAPDHPKDSGHSPSVEIQFSPFQLLRSPHNCPAIGNTRNQSNNCNRREKILYCTDASLKSGHAETSAEMTSTLCQVSACLQNASEVPSKLFIKEVDSNDSDSLDRSVTPEKQQQDLKSLDSEDDCETLVGQSPPGSSRTAILNVSPTTNSKEVVCTDSVALSIIASTRSLTPQTSRNLNFVTAMQQCAEPSTSSNGSAAVNLATGRPINCIHVPHRDHLIHTCCPHPKSFAAAGMSAVLSGDGARLSTNCSTASMPSKAALQTVTAASGLHGLVGALHGPRSNMAASLTSFISASKAPGCTKSDFAWNKQT